jgi:hypothetical protein
MSGDTAAEFPDRSPDGGTKAVSASASGRPGAGVRGAVRHLIGPRSELAVRALILRAVVLDAAMIVPAAGVMVLADKILAWMDPHGITLWGVNALLMLSCVGVVGVYALYVYDDLMKTRAEYRRRRSKKL